MILWIINEFGVMRKCPMWEDPTFSKKFLTDTCNCWVFGENDAISLFL